MSQAGVDATIERICSDDAFAAAIVRDGAGAIDESHDLTDDERTEIAEALRADVEDATDDVEGFIFLAIGDNTGGGGQAGPGGKGFGGVQFNNLSGVASFRGSFDRSASQLVWPGPPG